MRITTFLLFAGCMQLSAAGLSQTITLKGKDIPFQRVVEAIMEQTDYMVVSRQEYLRQAKPVTVDVRGESLDAFLERVFRGQTLQYAVDEKNILIGEAETYLGDASSHPNRHPERSAAESNGSLLILAIPQVSGRVTTEDGSPLEGASVVVLSADGKKTNLQTTTDRNGEFTLKNVPEGAQLYVSFIGYQSTTLVAAANMGTIKLQKSDSPLDEVQVIAYGTQTQRYSVGSVTRVSGKDIQMQPIANPIAGLAGRVPGLIVTQSSGVPGASLQIQLRGRNSIDNGSTPLIVIDGVVSATQNNNTNLFPSAASRYGGSSGTIPGQEANPDFAGSGISPFNNLNPADIESIEVLRDADATSIYGSRGANGVILITTKKGSVGKTRVSSNIYSGFSRVTRTMELMNTQQYLAMRREAFRNDGITPNATIGTLGYAVDLAVFDTTRYTDYKDQFFGGTAQYNNINASVSGGTSNTQFLVGSGYNRETNIFPGDFSTQRASVNMSVQHKSQDQRFTLGLSGNFAHFINNTTGSPSVFAAYTFAPNYPEFLDSLGNLVWSYGGRNIPNPMSYLFEKYDGQNTTLLSNLQLSYELLDGLKIQSSFGYNMFVGKELSISPKRALRPPATSSARYGNNGYDGWIIEPQLHYNKTVSKLRLNLLLGSTFQRNNNSTTATVGNNYSNDALLGSVSSAGTTSTLSNFSEYRYTAVFGRISALWDDRYLLNFSGRRDGSSRFGPGRQFGNFGSVGAGWIFSEEAWFENVSPFLSFGKIRSSYGTSGSDATGNYLYLSAWGSANIAGNIYQSSSGLLPLNPFNPSFGWEISRKFESGIDLGFLKDRLIVGATWFRNRSSNQLVSYPLPLHTGFLSVIDNWPATVENAGWEMLLNGALFQNSRFGWNTSLNLTIPRNRLVSYPAIEQSSYHTVYQVGEPLNLLYGYVFDQVDPTTGVYAFESTTDPARPIAYEDWTAFGQTDPKFFGGFRNTFSYKNIQLDILLEFSNKIGPTYLAQISSPGSINNQPIDVLRRWQREGDISEIQRFTSRLSGNNPANAFNNYFKRSSAVYGDASYIRGKSVSLTYDFSSILHKINVQGARFYVTAQNLFTITNYLGNDPETLNYFSLPPLRTIAAGIQVDF